MRLNHYLDNAAKPISEEKWWSYFNHSVLDLNLIPPVISSISKHQYCAVAFHHQNDWLVSFKSLDHQDIVFEIKDFYNFNTEELLKKFKNAIKLHVNIDVESIDLFSVQDIQLNKRIIFFAFSDHLHPLNDHATQLIHDYLIQQSRLSELSSDNAQLKQKITVLEDTNIGRTKYLSVISHDLRAPFHGILGCIDILMNEPESLNEIDKNKLIEYVYDTSHSTYTLLENLLNWSMSEGGRFYLKKIHFRVGDVVQMVLDLLCASSYKKQIKIECHLEAGLYVYADINMVTSILQNLVSNALKFTLNGANKKITIQTVSEDGQVKINIKDEGIGLTATQLEKLFQEESISTTLGTKGEKGTGLGLVLCKRFVEMNDGEISIASVLNEGTTFTLKFPLGNPEN